mgnify:CR=1 FL=1
MSCRNVLAYLKNELGKIFSLELSDQIDMFSAKYEYTGEIVCKICADW